MSRYIDAEQKITVTYYDEEHEEWLKKIKTIDDFLYENADEEIPTADVRENIHATFVSEIVKKENWKGQMQPYYQPNSCSNCHTALTGEENFCPNCGADFRKLREDEQNKE